jgi:hypothetical protein
MKNTYMALTLSAVMALPVTQAIAADEHYLDDSVVVGGYDVVAYHMAGKPTKGMAEFEASY